MSIPKSTLRIDVYDTHRRVPVELIDPMCEQMVQLEEEGMLLTNKLGITPGRLFSAESFRSDEFGLTAPEDSVFFALMDDRVLAGYSLYRHNAGRLRISALYVVLEYRGRGNGRRLLECVLAHIEEHYPCSSVEIGVIANNTRALKLYEDLGFTVPTHYTFMRSK